MKDKTHVPDKVEAFLLQVRHALFELIKAPDEKCIIVERWRGEDKKLVPHSWL